jgi:hypothetical protein
VSYSLQSGRPAAPVAFVPLGLVVECLSVPWDSSAALNGLSKACCPISLESSLIVYNRECATSKGIHDRRNKCIPITNLSDCLNCCCKVCTTIAEDPRSGADLVPRIRVRVPIWGKRAGVSASVLQAPPSPRLCLQGDGDTRSLRG